jgi:hypothetical protein
LTPPSTERLLRHRVSEADAVAAVGAAAGIEPVERGEDLVVLVARRGRQHQPGATGVDHHRHAVLAAQLRHQLAQRLFDQRQLVGSSIEPEVSIRNTRLAGGSVALGTS